MNLDLANQLKQVKLKKSDEPTRDYSIPKTGGYSSKEEIKEYENCVLAVNTEHWLDFLKDVTFPTVMATFTLKESQLFIDVYSRLYLNKDPIEAIKLDWREHLTEKEESQINTVKERLDKAMSIQRHVIHVLHVSGLSTRKLVMLLSNFRHEVLKMLL